MPVMMGNGYAAMPAALLLKVKPHAEPILLLRESDWLDIV